jgi:hypothetical protein
MNEKGAEGPEADARTMLMLRLLGIFPLLVFLASPLHLFE